MEPILTHDDLDLLADELAEKTDALRHRMSAQGIVSYAECTAGHFDEPVTDAELQGEFNSQRGWAYRRGGRPCALAQIQHPAEMSCQKGQLDSAKTFKKMQALFEKVRKQSQKRHPYSRWPAK